MHDWSALITRGFESKELDYKGPMSWDTSEKKSCCEIVKDILALANSNGGWLVIGVSEPERGKFVPDGLSADQAASFDTTRVNQFLQNYSDPPINTTAVRAPHDAKNFVIIQVPAFPDTPHICQKDYPGVLTASTLYVRTDNNESAPVKSSADFRQVIESSIRNRTDKLLSSFRAILKEGLTENSTSDVHRFEAEIGESVKACEGLGRPLSSHALPYRETAFFPATYNPDFIPMDKLREAFGKLDVEYRGWPFVYVSREDAETYLSGRSVETAMKGKECLHFSKLWQSGLLYTQEVLDLWKRDRDPKFLDFDHFCLLACDAVQTLARLYSDSLLPEEPVTMRFNLFGVKDLPFSSSNPSRLISRNSERWTYCRVDAIRYEATHRIADWRSGIEVHAVALCDYVFNQFNVHDATWRAEAKKLMVRMLERRL